MEESVLLNRNLPTTSVVPNLYLKARGITTVPDREHGRALVSIDVFGERPRIKSPVKISEERLREIFAEEIRQGIAARYSGTPENFFVRVFDPADQKGFRCPEKETSTNLLVRYARCVEGLVLTLFHEKNSAGVDLASDSDIAALCGEEQEAFVKFFLHAEGRAEPCVPCLTRVVLDRARRHDPEGKKHLRFHGQLFS